MSEFKLSFSKRKNLFFLLLTFTAESDIIIVNLFICSNYERITLIMTTYYILMALILGLAYPLCIRKPSMKKNIIYVCVTFGFMLILTALRYNMGNDYDSYRDYFYAFRDSDMTIAQAMDTFGFEIGYALLMKLTLLLGCDYTILNFFCAVLSVVPVAYTVCRHSKMPWISAWLYLTVTFLYNSMNFTRQSIAAAIVLLGYRFFMEKKHWAVLLTVLTASLFHTSVLLVIPVYILSLIKPTAKSMSIIGGSVFLVFLFSEKILTFATTYIFPSYAKYMDSIYLTVGLSPKFLIIPFIMAAVIISAYFMGMKDKDPRTALHVNFIFINMLIWIFIVKHFILERFTLPIYIFILISIPEALCFFKEYKPVLHKEQRSKDKKINIDRQLRLKEISRKLFPAAVCVTLVSTFVYNDFCSGQNVHGVFPYRSIINPYGKNDIQKLNTTPRNFYTNADALNFSYYTRQLDYTVIACASGNAGNKIDAPVKWGLEALGFETDFNTLNGQSYIGVVSNGKSVFEKSSDALLTESLSLYDGKYYIEAVSAGENAGSYSSLTLFGHQFLPEGEGICFAVFDNSKKKIIAASGYNFSEYQYTYLHSSAFNGIEYIDGFKEDFAGDLELYMQQQ